MIHRGKEYSYYYGLKDFVKERSLLDMDMVFNKYPNELFPFDFDTYFSNDMTCEIVTTNCLTGNAEYMTEESDRDRLMKICRASSSMPLVCPIVNVDGNPYLDGGLADSIPVKHVQEKKPVSRLEKDYDKLMAFYDHGYEMMKRELPRLKAYLEK